LGADSPWRPFALCNGPNLLGLLQTRPPLRLERLEIHGVFLKQEVFPMQLPDIELVSAKAHDAWMASKRAAGIHSRKSEGGEELMVPYDQLSEAAKDLDRAMVKAVYAAIRAAWDAQS
jgi:hypothetical protein